MAECCKECYQILTEITSYHIDNKSSDCPGDSTQEIEDHVAAWVRAHSRSLDDCDCASGCVCVHYEAPQQAIPLTPRNVTTTLQWVGTGLTPTGGRCIYVAVVTCQIKEIKIPVGICRPVEPFGLVDSNLWPTLLPTPEDE
jgi:hypothetical protein